MRTRKDRERYRQTIALSKANMEAEIRSIAKRFSHRPTEEVTQIIREKTGIAADPDFVRGLLR